MGTLSTAWNIATGALQADQAALNVVANNTANANTTGYTREISKWQESDPVQVNVSTMVTGVQMLGAVSQRDRILEQSLQQQSQEAEAGKTRLDALNSVQGIFSQSGSGTSAGGIAAAISGYFNSMAQLESAPSSSSLRQQVLSAADTVAQSMQGAAKSLAVEKDSLQSQSLIVLLQVNALTRSIASLNNRIQQTSPATDPGILEDQRQQDLLDLSQLIGIHTISTGANGITVTTSGGAVLVADNAVTPLTGSMVNGVTHFLSDGTDITTKLASGGGKLGGMLAARDIDIPNLQSSLDTLAYGISTTANASSHAGYDMAGAPGGDIFSPLATVAGSAAIMSEVISDPSGIAAAGQGAVPGVSLGSTDNSNAIRMADPASQLVAPGQTATSFYSSFITGLASQIQSLAAQNAAQQASLTQVQNQRNALSTVDLSEEASAMMNLERSYQAASKVFSILNSVMSSALNLGQQSTV
jgi:flagellar hook-associated protein 1